MLVHVYDMKTVSLVTSRKVYAVHSSIINSDIRKCLYCDRNFVNVLIVIGFVLSTSLERLCFFVLLSVAKSKWFLSIMHKFALR